MRGLWGLALRLLFAATGCGTIVVWNDSPCGSIGTAYTYRGTRADAEAAYDILSGNLDHTWPVEVLFGLDLPLSLVADTLTLPVAIYRNATAEPCK